MRSRGVTAYELATGTPRNEGQHEVTHNLCSDALGVRATPSIFLGFCDKDKFVLIFWLV